MCYLVDKPIVSFSQDEAPIGEELKADDLKVVVTRTDTRER